MAIADHLGISTAVATATLTRALEKLGLESRAELATMAGVLVPSGATTESAMIDERQLSTLKPRELQIARLAAIGLSYKEIALARGISPTVVAGTMAAILKKLSVPSRAELAEKFGAKTLFQSASGTSDKFLGDFGSSADASDSRSSR